MIVYPAIDLRDGKVIRLRHGDPTRQTTFSNEPLATAQRWQDEGARWLHMVNLDGAFSQANDNEYALRDAARLDLRVQFAGGLRSLADIERVLDFGAARVVIGTAALEQPNLIGAALARWGAEAIAVALDAREGRVATHGWLVQSERQVADVGREFAALGLRHTLFTDISRDGALSGVNIAATSELAHATGTQVIASGGVRDAADIRACAAAGNIAGVVIGMALYSGRLSLAAALAAASAKDDTC